MFFRHPRRGVKTRLAAEVGVEAALRLYAAMLTDLAERLAPLQRLLFPMVSPEPAGADAVQIPAAWPPNVPTRQHGATLTERMAAAFRVVFAAGADRAVLVGSDIPGLTAGHVITAFDALSTADAVLAESNDGGYYLVGFTARAFAPQTLDHTDGDPATVYERTYAGMCEAGLTVALGSKLSDVDTARQLQSALAASNGVGPRLYDEARTLGLIPADTAGEDRYDWEQSP